jgi:hypothetical protein
MSDVIPKYHSLWHHSYLDSWLAILQYLFCKSLILLEINFLLLYKCAEAVFVANNAKKLFYHNYVIPIKK